MTPGKGLIFICCAAVLLTLLPSAIRANGRVVFYPDSAIVTDQIKVRLTPDEGPTQKAVFLLPATAVPQTLTIATDDGSRLHLKDQQYRRVDPTGRAVNDDRTRKLARLREEQAAQRASLHAAEAQIQFWQSQTKIRSKTPQDAMTLSATIARNTRKAWQEKAAVQTKLENTERRIREIEEDLRRAEDLRRMSWEITARFTGPETQEAVLRYTYTLADCGWRPVYRLNALPGEKTVVFSREAEIWQHSGRDWQQADIVLSPRKAPSASAPGDIMPWYIRPSIADNASGKDRNKRKAKNKTGTKGRPGNGPSLVDAQADYFPIAVGTLHLPAGARVRIVLREEQWPAKFLYVLRPRESTQASLSAVVRIPDGLRIAGEPVSCLIDGALAGKRTLAVSGREGTILFGDDPQVAVETALQPGRSDEGKAAPERQRRSWTRRIDVHNRREEPVKVRIEEPAPLPGDERIRVTLRSRPEPTERTDTTVSWVTDIPAGTKTSVTIDIDVEAPRDMKLNMGW